MKTVIATVIETNEYEIKLDVENDATEDEIKDVIEEAYMDDDHNLLEKTGCCSICGEQIRMPHEIYKYCPYCGAIMDGEPE